ncbi:hypothetical protein SLS63_003546 [Diaporthe eres]|uniref:Uncharacterized protein n=1 Tax=Diaporthe eres TaxID=83184 RepID=A0ABR1PGA3_DIAER
MQSELCPWEEPIILAAAAGKIEELQQELAKQKDTGTRDLEFQRMSLHWAALGGHDAVVRLLLAHGADLNAIEPNRGRTPLLEAVAGGHEPVVRQLTDTGARVDAADMLGDTPLILATRQNSVAMVRILLEAGADPNVCDWRRGQTPLSLASEKGRDDIVDLLLHHCAAVSLADDEGTVPLAHALKGGHDGIAQTLAVREAGQDPRKAEQILSTMMVQLEEHDPYQDLDQGAALLKASQEGRQDIVQDILAKNAHVDIDVRDKEGNTPLSHSAGEGDIGIATLLLDRGADVNAVDAMQWTPLMAAAERGLEEMGVLLLQRGAHPGHRDADGFTPLLLAASAGCVGLVSKLMGAGADPNAVDESEGLTAMSRAAEYDHVAVVELLLARGVSPNVDDRTLLCALRDRDRSEEPGSDGYRLLRTLVQHGADVFMDGWTDERPLVIAAERGLTDIVELFLRADFASTTIRQEHIRDAVCVAAEEGERGILKMLMEHYVRCDTKSELETPWEWAKNYGFGQSLEPLRPYFSPDTQSSDDSH